MSDNLVYFKSAIWKFILWLMRPKNIIFTTGRLFLVTGFGGGALFSNFSIKHLSDNGNNIVVDFSSDQVPYLLQHGLWLLGFIGALILIAEIIYISLGRSRTLVIGIEHIGLKKRISTPLSAFLGRAETIPIDLTTCYENDKVSNPTKALSLTKFGIEENLRSKVAEIGNKEATIVYGGMPPVGLGFLAGYLMSNTYHVEVWDYNRNANDGKNWYKVDGFADVNRPIISWDNYVHDKDVCLLMSISYPVTVEQVKAKVACSSYVEVTIPDIKHDNMASIEKITTFEKEFGELLKKLAADGTERVHIFCAAQSSFNFCMGRQVTRNHPAIIVYEYDISDPKKYPWGVIFNTKDSSSPAIV
ncbi:hypothetical protein AU255_12645 [Methyloprofundus sedimenti]|uniref:SMODS-associated and fused to various effectors domain-containing protein n=1 Tax=Methyloprofundus sedimenti TaxID=1420851 RepID=A0A1V8MAM2_9GAMM|nr:SAVED domain-containing protein [Methyloprofundus sedimenti]OQK18619.1 hypothetical protein AU255_12645 [Methyloprofundus sedimenti]